MTCQSALSGYANGPSRPLLTTSNTPNLVDRPSVYGLPEAPFNPWLHMMGDYVRSIARGLAAIAALLVVVLFLKP